MLSPRTNRCHAQDNQQSGLSAPCSGRSTSLDALAEADTELGTNEIARRTGINASTVSRLLATLVAGGLVEHVQDSGRSARPASAPARQRGAGPPGPPADRAPVPAGARRLDRRDGDALRARGARRGDGRLRPEPLLGARGRPARPTERRARHRHREGAARLRPADAAARTAEGLHRAHDHAAQRALRRARGVRERGYAYNSASARRISTRSQLPCGAAARARGDHRRAGPGFALRAGRRWRRPCARSSSTPRSSRWSSAGAVVEEVCRHEH